MYKYNFSLPEGIERSIAQGERRRRQSVSRAEVSRAFEPIEDFLDWTLSRPYGFFTDFAEALTEIFDRIDPADIIGKEARGLYSAIRGRYRLNPDPRKQARRQLPEMSNYLERQIRDETFYRRRRTLLNDDPANYPPPEIPVPTPDEISGLITEYLETLEAYRSASESPAPQEYRFTGGGFDGVITVCTIRPARAPKSHARGDWSAARPPESNRRRTAKGRNRDEYTKEQEVLEEDV